MKKLILSILLFILSASASKAAESGTIYTRQDSIIYEGYISKFASKQDVPLNQLLTETAKYFLNKPYVAATLEVSGDEKLVINLREFDCTSFVENCIALSQAIKSGDRSFSNYCRLLTRIRYRDGIIHSYASRLHYSTEWVMQNRDRDIWENIAMQLGGGKVKKTIDFMSTHPASYKHLKNNPANISQIKDIEQKINDADAYVLVEKSGISRIANKIKDGDIILFATSVPGLDYSHMGIAHWQNGRLHFIHASSKHKAVIAEPRTLAKYCNDSKSCTGITVLRMKEQ
ncbi:N-acetylmuramoyl-L-alanine amidase-like domain-containing protein [Dysgonomonas sp. 511]|uniref:N-acetylmuramoyl-L-alanine amidase-like domain-containing protein n=1 Tax=Dysgonomonas sp. 511 TaxID=2302930 RepID=UPI0013D21611|nr:N-acetylmuramoyl-L-alanine amidase-like domain-containing protein [Dysgonomonas sp. 511]NDV78672.1 DUF1460 domain-containing protein [Dysgonomonas sp. 511]